MTAKPIIHIDIVIDEGQFPEGKNALTDLSYLHQGDLGIDGREAFDLINPVLKSQLPHHHLYVCFNTSNALKRHLAFRDFLRDHPKYVSQLSDLKWLLAERYDNDRNAYMQGKDTLVDEIINLALHNTY